MQQLLWDRVGLKNDVVFTPDWCAKDCIEWFKPTGAILDPCRGDGAFWKHMPEGALWCELREGKDFFNWTEPVNWIISNPPYSNFREWLAYSFKIAENIVYLLPLNKVFSAYGQLSEIREQGWIKHIRLYGTGARVGFPMGNAVGAIHFQKGHKGETTFSWYF